MLSKVALAALKKNAPKEDWDEVNYQLTVFCLLTDLENGAFEKPPRAPSLLIAKL